MSAELDYLREEVERMLVAAGFEVLDIVTLDLDPEHGETEWIVGPHRHYLWLSNNFGKMLLASHDAAVVPIEREIDHLYERVFGKPRPTTNGPQPSTSAEIAAPPSGVPPGDEEK